MKENFDNRYEPYHGKRYQIVTWAQDIDYDERYDSDDLNELKQDVKEFLKTEDEVGIVDYETGEWVYAYSKDGFGTPNLERVYPLNKNLKNKQKRHFEKMDRKNIEKDWLSDSQKISDEAFDPEFERFVGRMESMREQLQDMAVEADEKIGIPTEIVDEMFGAFNMWDGALGEIKRWI